MANQLKMALVESILTLHQRGWSQRRIARELGVNRETVARQLQQARTQAKPAIAPPGSADAPSQAKPAIAPPGVAYPDPSVFPVPTGADTEPADPQAIAGVPAPRGPGRPSDCEPWHDLIVAKRQQGLSAQRIYQDLIGEHGFTGSYYSVRRFVGRLEPTTELPFRRLECNPGEEAQVDFGTGAPLHTPSGRRRCHVFRIILSYSRKGYSEAVCRQTTDDLVFNGRFCTMVAFENAHALVIGITDYEHINKMPPITDAKDIAALELSNVCGREAQRPLSLRAFGTSLVDLRLVGIAANISG